MKLCRWIDQGRCAVHKNNNSLCTFLCPKPIWGATPGSNRALVYFLYVVI
jgi:hypothetical protein